jgi:hypothetical protein
MVTDMLPRNMVQHGVIYHTIFACVLRNNSTKSGYSLVCKEFSWAYELGKLQLLEILQHWCQSLACKGKNKFHPK